MKKALLYLTVYFLFSTIGFSQTPLPGPDAGKILQQENENNKIKSRPKGLLDL